jgi:hypothetical protein
MNSSHRASKIGGFKQTRPAVSGATCFFRNRALFQAVRELIQSLNKEECSVLFHSCSVGAEVYSFVISCLEDPGFTKQIKIHATDINPDYLNFANQGEYPLCNVNELTPEERKYFLPTTENRAIADAILREKIHFLNPCDFRTFKTQQNFDVVFVLNSLCYVNSPEQALAISQIARYNSGYLVLHGAHLNTIKGDLINNGYIPVCYKGKEISAAWHLSHLKGADVLTKITDELLIKPMGKEHYFSDILRLLLFRVRCPYKMHSIFAKTVGKSNDS